MKLKLARCLKDKVASGHFLVVVHVLDRLGGNRIHFNHSKITKTYKDLSGVMREFAKKKRNFLNAANRQV